MNDLLKRRMSATQQAAEITVGDEAYETLFQGKPMLAASKFCDLPLKRLCPFFTADIGFHPYPPEKLKAFSQQLAEQEAKHLRADLDFSSLEAAQTEAARLRQRADALKRRRDAAQQAASGATQEAKQPGGRRMRRPSSRRLQARATPSPHAPAPRSPLASGRPLPASSRAG